MLYLFTSGDYSSYGVDELVESDTPITEADYLACRDAVRKVMEEANEEYDRRERAWAAAHDIVKPTMPSDFLVRYGTPEYKRLWDEYHERSRAYTKAMFRWWEQNKRASGEPVRRAEFAARGWRILPFTEIHSD